MSTQASTRSSSSSPVAPEETTAVAAERGKGKGVAITFDPPKAQPLLPPDGQTGQRGGTEPVDKGEGHGGSPLKTVGLVAGIAGVVGLGLGVAFGVEALSTKSANCSASGLCEPAGSAGNAYSQATISTVGFVMGGVLLAGGVTLFLMAPRGGHEHRGTSAAMAPMIGPSSGGFQIVGKW